MKEKLGTVKEKEESVKNEEPSITDWLRYDKLEGGLIVNKLFFLLINLVGVLISRGILMRYWKTGWVMEIKKQEKNTISFSAKRFIIDGGILTVATHGLMINNRLVFFGKPVPVCRFSFLCGLRCLMPNMLLRSSSLYGFICRPIVVYLKISVIFAY